MTTFSTATGKARLGLALLSATGGCVRSWENSSRGDLPVYGRVPVSKK